MSLQFCLGFEQVARMTIKTLGRFSGIHLVLQFSIFRTDSQSIHIVQRLITVQTIKIEGFFVAVTCTSKQTNAGEKFAFIIIDNHFGSSFGIGRCFEIPSRLGIGISASVVEIIEIEQGSVLKTAVVVESHHRERTKIPTGFDDVTIFVVLHGFLS